MAKYFMGQRILLADNIFRSFFFLLINYTWEYYNVVISCSNSFGVVNKIYGSFYPKSFEIWSFSVYDYCL